MSVKGERSRPGQPEDLTEPDLPLVAEIDADGRGVASVVQSRFPRSCGVVTNSTPAVHADVNVTGAHVLELYAGEGNGTVNFGSADFGNPQLTCNN